MAAVKAGEVQQFNICPLNIYPHTAILDESVINNMGKFNLASILKNDR